MRNLILITILLTAVACSTDQADNNTLSLQPASIDAGERIYEYERIMGEVSNTFGTVTETISREGDLLSIAIVQDINGFKLADSLFAMQNSLKPVKYRSVTEGMQDIEIQYNMPGETVLDIYINNPNQQRDTTETVNTSETHYDFHWPHILISALNTNTSVGDTVNVPVFTYRDGKAEQSFVYAGEEELQKDAETVETVKWTATNPSLGTDYTFWIEKDGHRLIQYKSALSNGMIFWLREKDL